MLVLLVGALSSLAVVQTRLTFPTLSGEQSVPGLNGQVEVLRDGYGVPHIYADTPEDLFMVQGYVHAQDRFFEMDFRRHVVAGRLSEWFGASQYSTDAFIRTLGWRRVSEQELGLLSSSTRRYLDAYSAGVNAYLDEKGRSNLALEFSVLGLTGLSYSPEPWTPVDSLGWIKAMAWDLGGNSDQELELARVTSLFGEDRALELWPTSDPEDHPPILTAGAVRNGAFQPGAVGNGRPTLGRPALGQPSGATTSAPSTPVDPDALAVLQRAGANTTALDRLLGTDGLGTEIGSNSWVIAGSRTSTGKPLLSNDPHLAASIPSVFMQVGLHCRTVSVDCPFDVTGFSFSGMPGVVIGRNTRVAWGFTTSYTDVQDLFLEQVQGSTVKVGKKWEPLTVRTEEVRVHGEDQPRVLTIRSTRHGPLLSDVQPGAADVATRTAEASNAPPDGYAVSLAWTGLIPSRTMDAVFQLDTATDFTSFRAAAARFAAPSQNLVYADVEGNIGYQLNGSIPIRGEGDGLHPSPGWDRAYDWTGTIPFGELPYVQNPPSGMIVTANQTILSAPYPYVLNNGDQSYGWRSDVINDRLSRSQVTPQQSIDLFSDTTMGIAEVLTPRLLRVRVDDAWVAEGQRQLVGWDYRATADSGPAAYFNVVLRNVWRMTFDDELPEDLWPSGGERWQAVITTMAGDPTSWWWDDKTTPNKVETRDDILLAAMTQARKELTARTTEDTAGWEWGKLHRAKLVHPTLGTSGIAPVEAIFNRGSILVGGSGGTVNALAWRTTTDYQVTSGPTMRMLVDFADLDRSKWVNQSGASGHPFHPNYDDQLKLWSTNQLWDFAASRSAVEAASTNRLVLIPPG